jgi:cephalosporin-C deacetylase
MLFDLPLDELHAYRPAIPEPEDFDAFWADTLADARHDVRTSLVAVDVGLRHAEVFDVTFGGFGGHPVKAWLYVPHARSGPRACVVQYIGYTGGRGLAHEHLLWSAAGYVHLVVDVRGQGTNIHTTGDTYDVPGAVGPHRPGFLTLGIEARESYYYRRVFVDAVRAVAVARGLDVVDDARVAVTGGSQGGGITLAVAGLVPGLAAVMADVPFLCHFRRASEITDAHPYQEIAEYCRAHRDGIDAAFHTLAYFDGVSFAARASAPALFSVALMDEICPPSTVFAAFNAYASHDKRIEVYPYNGHEGGGGFHHREQLQFLSDHTDG